MRLYSFIQAISIVLFFPLTTCVGSCASSEKGKVEELVTLHQTEQIVDIGMQAGKEYVVKTKIDLKGGQVNIPAGVTISFKKGGVLVNGTLNGNETRFKSVTNDALGVKLKGTWCVEEIKDVIFSKEYLSDAEIIGNINTILSDSVQNEVTIKRDYTVTIPKSGGAGLDLKSNTSLFLDCTLTLAANDYKSYSIVNIKGKENIAVRGGIIVGDVSKHSYIEGTTSEWGMGVNISNSKSVTVSDMYITACIGDGIYVTGDYEPSIGCYDKASKNIVITNVICDNNRRQGISVIHVDGLKISNSYFINTGQIEGTPPSAGIDIEPEVLRNRNMSVKNVLVEDCIFRNNKGMSIATNCTYESAGKVNYENIVFKNCKSDGLLKAQSTDLIFKNCSFKEIRFASLYAPTRISFEGCTISGGYGIMIYAPSGYMDNSDNRLLTLEFKNCTISVAEGETQTSSLISCYKKYVSNLKYVRMENCRFIIPQSKPGNYSLTDYNLENKLKITSSSIEMKGQEFDTDGIELHNTKVYCKKIVGTPAGATNKVITNQQ